jgi:large-conductance mechanosensitive channel
VLAFVAILIGGTAGGFIGYAFVDLQVTGDSSVWAGLGALVGAIIAALGTAVVVVLTLRAMGEWNTIREREESATAAAKSSAATRNVPRVR